IYSIFFLIIVLIFFPTAASLELNTHIFDRIIWEKYLNYFTSITHLSTVIQLATALIMSLFYSEISDFMGQRVLKNFFTGKYHMPIEEERIFMFLDMKSSTTIAEKLGHFEYFKLLRAYYNCFTDAIIEHEGEIYQYVGDEIILSWKFQSNQPDNRCIDCFFAMKENLEKKENWFQQQFGIVPTFKAGIHLGKVTTGEIGVLKKDILFSGDVLNVAARIQGLCNTYKVDLIISDDMLRQIDLGLNYKVSLIGEEELRGKEEKKELYSLVKCKELLFSNSEYSVTTELN
ncbi:MAG: adenylate/guanylate cyclase domain-containing protein, partial [Saprospiraceae bacterium]